MSETGTKSNMGISDGRLRRSLDSRQKIIQALLDYCEEGHLVPTAQEAADRAGVSLRTVFRHFSDMGSLYVEMDKALQERYRPLFSDQLTTGPLESRIEALVARRSAFFEQISPYLRSTLAQAWRYETLQRNYERVVQSLRKDLMIWLPELEDLPERTQWHVEVAASFEVWDRLRRQSGIGQRAAQDAVVGMITTALNG